MQLFVPTQPYERKAKAVNQWKNFKKGKTLNVGKDKSDHFIYSTWKAFTKNTSIHGVHYLTEASITLLEKLIWACAVLLAITGMFYSCVLLSERFRTGLTSTVFESITFKVSEITFPAVTFCNNNRLNYNKTDAAVAKFLPKNSSTKSETFVKFLQILQNLEFGSFDNFAVIKNDETSEIDNMNLTEIYDFMMHDCKDLFVSCSWKSKPFNCCEWFSKQRSMYGICWSFNSFTSLGSKFINVSLSSLNVL